MFQAIFIAMSLPIRFSNKTIELNSDETKYRAQPPVEEVHAEMDIDKLNRESRELKQQQEVERRNKMADAWRMREQEKKG